jgi:RimJ/RimL family protein N-acetyltransferase
MTQSGTAMPALETERLIVRPFEPADLEACHQLLDLEAWQTGRTIDQRETWLRWTILSYEMLADLRQPPYGDRAVVLRSTGTLVGAVGFVPGLMPFARLPSFGGQANDDRATAEVGLFWATRSAQQNRGYATEAASALVRYAFEVLDLARILAWTDYDNTASQAVMRRLGMSIERNPQTEPAWFQVVGVLQNPGS